MRVLMLTWEFPPFIVGGLGMACYGLVKALLGQGVEVCLCLPTEKRVFFRLVKPEDADTLTPSFASTELERQYVESTFTTLEERLAFLGVRLRPEVYKSPTGGERPSGEARLFGEQSLSGEDGYEAVIARELQAQEETRRHVVEKIDRSLAGDSDVFRQVKEYAVRVNELAKNMDFDLIHAHDWLTYPAAVLLKSAFKKPLVTHIHATEFDRAGGPGNPGIHEIEYAGLTYADRVVAVSKYTASMIVQRYQINPEKIRVVYNAYQIAKSQREKRRLFKGPVVLFLGRITLQKGPDYFLEVAKRVVEVVPNVKFIMAGAGDMERQLIHKSAYYMLQTKFLFTGFLRRGDVERILSSSDIFILPSVSEPFGIAPLEAMSYGIVALISKQAGVSEVVKSAFKIDFWDIDRMVEVIVDLLKNPEKLKEIGQAGAREVDRIGWDKAGTSVKEVYRECAC
jgi:glycosyltransferase involved in cell wall biosynthesis